MTGEQVTLTEEEWLPLFYALNPGDNGRDTRDYIERILAARVPEAKAEAWDEGYERAALDRYESLFDPGGKSPNPYRAEAPQ